MKNKIGSVIVGIIGLTVGTQAVAMRPAVASLTRITILCIGSCFAYDHVFKDGKKTREAIKAVGQGVHTAKEALEMRIDNGVQTLQAFIGIKHEETKDLLERQRRLLVEQHQETGKKLESLDKKVAALKEGQQKISSALEVDPDKPQQESFLQKLRKIVGG